MSDGAIARRSDLICKFAQRTRLMKVGRRLPIFAAKLEFGLVDFEIDCSLGRIDRDDIAVLDQPDWTTDRCLRADVADAEPRVAPENRPSVTSATLSPAPWP